jgi:hypothetical protein
MKIIEKSMLNLCEIKLTHSILMQVSLYIAAFGDKLSAMGIHNCPTWVNWGLLIKLLLI